MQPQNFHQFDIDRYYITVNSTSGDQHITTACGQCTNTVLTVSDDRNNMRVQTTFTVTISARNLCEETGPTATASYTLSKLSSIMLYHFAMCRNAYVVEACYINEALWNRTGIKTGLELLHLVPSTMPVVVISSNLRLHAESQSLLVYLNFWISANLQNFTITMSALT